MFSKRGHYHALPWIARPPKEEPRYHNQHLSNQSSHLSSQEFGKDQVAVSVHQAPHAIEHGSHHHEHEEAEGQLPIFSEREEATTIELFYDLFFVANLSAFTNNHQIDSQKNLLSYIGFFSLLWFNWLQFALYDVRFSVDSVFERAAKALHLAVMIGFAAIGTDFDTSNTAKNHTSFQALGIILMFSRVILLCQYTTVLLWTKKYKHLRTPILIHMGVQAAGAIICLGVAFSFDGKKVTHVYLMWYVLVVVEALALFVTSSHWRKVSFKTTNLNERCNVLTLIILGEGVIVLTKSFTTITSGQNYSAQVIGQIISSCVIIYFLYMLYFDQGCKGFGTIRQQFWALAHFPFHVSLVLLMEGVSRFVIWVNALQIVFPIVYRLDDLFQSSSNITEVVDTMQSVTDNIYGLIKDKVNYADFQIDEKLAQYAKYTDPNSDEALTTGYDLVSAIANAIFKFFKITGPKKPKDAKLDGAFKPSDPEKDFEAIYKTYDLVYEYMFIAAGFTLIIMAALIIIAKRKKVAGDWAAVAARTVFGIGLACVAALVTNVDRQTKFMTSPWMLPSIAITLVVLVVIDGIFGYVLPAAKHEEHGEKKHESG